MPGRLRASTIARDLFVALAALSIALKLLMPPGFMPGTGLSRPIMLCDGQDSMPTMAMPGTDRGSHHAPGKAPSGMGDHNCPFAASSATLLAPQLDPPGLPGPPAFADDLALRRTFAIPGRGLAAPPPPSHAPPLLQA